LRDADDINNTRLEPKAGFAVGKAATLQAFVAVVGQDKLEIDVAAWGEGYLKVNGRNIAYVNDGKDGRQVFRKLARTAELYLPESALSDLGDPMSYDARHGLRCVRPLLQGAEIDGLVPTWLLRRAA
jgi:hypothetical protein